MLARRVLVASVLAGQRFPEEVRPPGRSVGQGGPSGLDDDRTRTYRLTSKTGGMRWDR